MAIDVVNLVGLTVVKLWFLLILTAFLLSRSRNTSAAVLHALLLLVLFSLMLVPFLVDRIPGVHLYLLPSDFAGDLYWSYHQDSASRIFTLLGSGCLICSAFILLRRLLQIRQVFGLMKKARTLSVVSHEELLPNLSSSLKIKRRIHLRYSDQITTPLTVGLFKPWILLPRESLLWDEHRLRRILLHEIAHVARCDWFVKQLAYGVVALLWILPPAWKLLKKLEWLAELACDDVVIAFEGRRSDYADDLLDMAASQTFAGAVALTESHTHYDRIAAVLDGTRIRQTKPAKFWLHALVFFLVLFCVSGLQLTQKIKTKKVEYMLQPLVISAADDVKDVAAIGDADFLGGDKSVHDSLPEFPRTIIQLDQDKVFTPVATLDPVLEAPLVKVSHDQILPLIKIIPEYPQRALRRAREGVVEVTFSVLPNGETAQIKVIRAEPRGIFDKAAADAVRQYRYAPREQTLHGMSEVFEFRLIEDAN
jgi:TonB family C-terminal domain